MKTPRLVTILLVVLSITVTGCGNDKKSNASISTTSNLGIWMTTSNQTKLLEYQGPINFTSGDTAGSYIITINSATYQIMDGFGASFTDSSAYLLYNKLDINARNSLINALFDYNQGIGLSFLRQPMGASDYALTTYSYDDVAGGTTDAPLANFSIDHDKDYIIPAIISALAINPSLKVMATPWSPPAWMKDTGSMIGKTNNTQSSLLTQYYGTYANYFVKFIQAYEKAGIPIYAITVQNEPLYTPTNYPGMYMTADQQTTFINSYLGPTFTDNGIKTKIICLDDNWKDISFAETVLSRASTYVAGSAWHNYGGTVEQMTTAHNAYPDKDIWFTEGSGGTWVGDWKARFLDQMASIIRYPRNWAKSVVWWNIALDENNGPTLLSSSTCKGLVEISNSGAVTKNVDYFTMGHISKFVLPGAVRIGSNTYSGDLEDVAFKNPDGSYVLIVSNRTNVSKTFKISWKGKVFSYTIPGEAGVTFKWAQ